MENEEQKNFVCPWRNDDKRRKFLFLSSARTFFFWILAVELFRCCSDWMCSDSWKHSNLNLKEHFQFKYSICKWSEFQFLFRHRFVANVHKNDRCQVLDGLNIRNLSPAKLEMTIVFCWCWSWCCCYVLMFFKWKRSNDQQINRSRLFSKPAFIKSVRVIELLDRWIPFSPFWLRCADWSSRICWFISRRR